MVNVVILINNTYKSFVDLLLYEIFKYKQLDQFNISIYNSDISKERKLFNMYKSGNGVMSLPFIGIFKDNYIIKGFYPEDEKFNINNIVEYLLTLSKNMIVDLLRTGVTLEKEKGNSGYDLRAKLQTIKTMYDARYSHGTLVIDPGGRALIPTGIFIALPEGYEAQVRPRSGLAIKHGITILNTPGTIDENYRGEICVILHNTGSKIFVVNENDRIAQLVFTKVEDVEWNIVDELNSTNRDSNGFGSSGVK